MRVAHAAAAAFPAARRRCSALTRLAVVRRSDSPVPAPTAGLGAGDDDIIVLDSGGASLRCALLSCAVSNTKRVPHAIPSAGAPGGGLAPRHRRRRPTRPVDDEVTIVDDSDEERGAGGGGAMAAPRPRQRRRVEAPPRGRGAAAGAGRDTDREMALRCVARALAAAAARSRRGPVFVIVLMCWLLR